MSPNTEQVSIVLRGLGVVLFCGLLFAGGGGLVADLLNWFAPGYYPGVFPGANRGSHASDVGVGTGIIQGLMLGLLVGTVIAVGLGWFDQLRAIPVIRALVLVLLCGFACCVVGTLIGYFLGTFHPGYYRSVVSGGRQPDFKPVDVGIGLGCSQGLILGVIVGALVVVGSACYRWWRTRATTPRECPRTQFAP
jgi:hypothetical protein